MRRAGARHKPPESVRSLDINPINSFAEAAEHKKVQAGNAERQAPVFPCPGLRGNITNDRLRALDGEKLRERRTFRQHMQRVSNSATNRIAYEGCRRCGSGESYAHRILNALGANALQPCDDRLGCE